MKIIKNIPDHLPEPCVATIGFFDGVHKGHIYLIEQVREIARQKGLRSAVITFPIHPRKVMNADYKPDLLTNYEEKINLLSQTGIDYCFVLDFTKDISKLEARDFMRQILKDRFNIDSLLIGHDHRFGYNRSENYEDYYHYGKQLHIDVIQAKACVIDNVTVSSSLIRRLLLAGEVQKAEKYLGYLYSLKGLVVGGHKVGRKLGFPTANISVDDPEKLIPADGVYAVNVTIGKTTHDGMLNIGQRPTIDNGYNTTIEVHILNYQSDIYNFTISISFFQRIRNEKKFNNLNELIQQLLHDKKTVETAFQKKEIGKS